MRDERGERMGREREREWRENGWTESGVCVFLFPFEGVGEVQNRGAEKREDSERGSVMCVCVCV